MRPLLTLLSLKVLEANRDFTDSTAQKWPTLPLAILVDEKSASAAEIVAGALQDHDRAVLIGEVTYGKGSAQSVIPLGEVGGLKITTAKWYTPSGRSISRRLDRDDEDAPPGPRERTRYKTSSGRIVYDGGGITPDVIASDSAFSRDIREFQTLLGRKVGQFRDALTDYARTLKGSGSIDSERFVVTPEMLDEVWDRMMNRGVVMDRSIYDEYSTVVSQLLAYDISRYVFGPEAEFKRRVTNDAAIRKALEITTGATTQQAMLRKALAPQQTQETRTAGRE